MPVGWEARRADRLIVGMAGNLHLPGYRVERISNAHQQRHVLLRYGGAAGCEQTVAADGDQAAVFVVLYRNQPLLHFFREEGGEPRRSRRCRRLGWRGSLDANGLDLREHRVGSVVERLTKAEIDA